MRRLAGAAGAAALGLTALVGHADQPAPARLDTIAALTQSLAAVERRLGPADPRLLAILDPLARLQYQAADIGAATASRRRALKIAIGSFGSQSAPAAKALIALARLYIEAQRYLDAEPLLIAAGNILEGGRGAGDDADMTDVLVGRARIALANGRRQCARRSAEAAVALGPEDGNPAHRRALRVLGATLAAAREFTAGEHILRRALALDRSAEDARGTARSLSGLANAYLRQRRFAEALPLIEQATEIDQSHLGPTHPLIADDLYGLGLVYLATRRVEDARTTLRAAAELLNSGAGRGSTALAYIELELSRADRKAGDEKAAQSRFADARRILAAAADEERERERRI